MKAYSQIEKIFEKLDIIDNISSILSWDSSVIMPSGGHEARTKQLCYLTSSSHDILSSPEIGDLIIAAKNEQDLNSWQKANLRLMDKLYKEQNSLDKALKEIFSEATSNCEMVWREARQNNDYKLLIPIFKEVIKLTREISTVKSESLNCSKYDALLDSYDPGRKSAQIDQIFANLAIFLKDKIPQIIDFQAKQNIIPFTHKYEIEKQKELGVDCMNKFGFDFSRGRLDISLHPFCGGTPTDVRITTRYDESEFISSLCGILHEAGHGIYEQNLPKEWISQPVGKALGMAMHESQSLLVEMQLCRSKPFLNWLEKSVISIFGDKAEHKKDNLYNHVNKVARSLIRVDADEVTYPCHVMLRYELEKLIINNELEAEDLPSAFNEKMQQYLGISPTDDKNGCMQDIHWPSGFFGYFPCYTMGALIAAQVFAKIKTLPTDLDKKIENGEFQVIFDWLRTNIHNYGSLLSVDDLLLKSTGTIVDIECYKNYIDKKYLF